MTSHAPSASSPRSVADSSGRWAWGKVGLAASAILLVAWFAWLGHTALTKSREPVVSRAQAAAAVVVVVAELDGTGDSANPQARVKESLTTPSPPVGQVIVVKNLPICTGFGGPGEYLLLLQPLGEGEFVVVGPQNSPAARLEGISSPKIYRWGPAVRAQVLRLFTTAG
ncbi:MAG: hypothetical protein RMJ56_13260 [Gemmataceae bacterium]|nr:hypothetical protein [Gemmata sp.]MDW8198565.1 hypothetical protein [Gemmataceae bacterium]